MPRRSYRTDLTLIVESDVGSFGLKRIEGLGMHNIRLRARYLNAELNSEPGSGTTLTLRVPLEAPAATPAA